MAFPIKVCTICGEEFELRPGKPGFANRCPACSEPEADEHTAGSEQSKTDREGSAARRKAIRDLLYRKDN